MDRGISIIICCYNSAWIIQRTLDALKAQRFSHPIPYEIVLVDNCCTDDTVAVARDTMNENDINFRIVRENNPGLANARRKGIKEVKYEYVLYCDDDNLLCPDYVATMVNIMDNNSNVGAVGGKGMAEFQTEPAEIVKKNIGCYAVGSQLNHKDWLFGAGLASRTELVREVYSNQKCYLIGRKGKKLLSGDDSELVMSMVLRGYQVFATDDVSYIHVLKANRLTEAYFHKLYEGLVLPLPVFEVFRSVINDRPFKNILDNYKTCIKAILGSYIHFQRADAKKTRKNYLQQLHLYNYWGIYRLWRIYEEWSLIKQNYKSR